MPADNSLVEGSAKQRVGFTLTKEQAIHLARVLLAATQEWDTIDVTGFRLQKRSDGTFPITITSVEKPKCSFGTDPVSVPSAKTSAGLLSDWPCSSSRSPNRLGKGSASTNLDHQQCVDVVPDTRIAVSRPTQIREHVMFDVYQVVRLGSYFTRPFNDDSAISSEYRTFLR
jgi:hypothetical protein